MTEPKIILEYLCVNAFILSVSVGHTFSKFEYEKEHGKPMPNKLETSRRLIKDLLKCLWQLSPYSSLSFTPADEYCVDYFVKHWAEYEEDGDFWHIHTCDLIDALEYKYPRLCQEARIELEFGE